jgi:C1q domain
MKSVTTIILLLISTGFANAQNIGIGTTTPEYKLDVNGRMRLRNAPGQTAGIWLDGIANTNIGFMGTYNNNTIGFYATVSNWQLVLNTDNGNVGIGTVSPTTKLDVNGSLRLRGSSPANGATLVSQDGNGNTAWQRTYAFRAAGLTDYEDINRTYNTIAKINFHYTPVYNIGLSYNGATSTFTAPVDGIYTFSANLESYPNADKSGSIGMFLMQTRSNVNTVLAQSDYGVFVAGDVTHYQTLYNLQLHGDFRLQAGDQIWIRVNNGSLHKFYGGAESCSFSGHLVSQIF